MLTQNSITSRVDCETLQAKLPALMADLLLDPEAVPSTVKAHIDACESCRVQVELERAHLDSTMLLLDEWKAADPSPYFNSRMMALLREEQAKPSGSLLDRLRNWMLLSNFRLKPVAGAAALGILLAAGGGTYFDLANQPAVTAPQSSATVKDLQSLDDNAQVFQQMNSLDQDSGDAPANNL